MSTEPTLPAVWPTDRITHDYSAEERIRDAVLAERERCALVAEAHLPKPDKYWDDSPEDIATNIRSGK